MSEVSALSSQSKIFIKFSLNQNLAKSMGQISKCLLSFYSVGTKANFYWLKLELIWDRTQKKEWKLCEQSSSLRFYPQHLFLSRMRKTGYSCPQKIWRDVLLPKRVCKNLSSSFSALFPSVLLFTQVTPSSHPFLLHKQIYSTIPNRFWGRSRKAEKFLLR